MSRKSQRLPVQDLLSSPDALSDEACKSLINYAGEDDLVDFKESFDPSANSRSWIELAIDCVAFANTVGGYLVFGVRDKTWDPVGLKPEMTAALADIKKVLEKINRGLAPPITGAKSRQFVDDGKEFVILTVPPSLVYTHIFESELTWKNPKGDTLPGVRQGAIYVRRSGSNSILTSADFEQLVDRRLKQFREKVLEGLARVVNASPGHETLTVTLDSNTQSNIAVKIVDAPAFLDLAGKSLALKADSISDKINMMIALTRTQSDPQIDVRLLYGLYAVRQETVLTEEQREWVIYHSLRTEVPAFYWLKQVKDSKARDLIAEAFASSKFWRQVAILNYAGFYSERLHERLYEKLGKPAVDNHVRKFRTKVNIFNVGPSRDSENDASRATELARALATNHDAQSRSELDKLDCSLYAPFD